MLRPIILYQDIQVVKLFSYLILFDPRVGKSTFDVLDLRLSFRKSLKALGSCCSIESTGATKGSGSRTIKQNQVASPLDTKCASLREAQAIIGLGNDVLGFADDVGPAAAARDEVGHPLTIDLLFFTYSNGLE